MNKRLRIVIDSGMVLLFIGHHILNIAWWKHIFHGKYTPFRILGTAVNLALAIIMLALPISGMMLSRHVFRFLHFGGTSVARSVHVLASYWGLVLMSFHAGMHGNVMMGMIRKNTNPRQLSKIKIWSLRIIAVLLTICGIHAFVKNEVSSYLFLRTHFYAQRSSGFDFQSRRFFASTQTNDHLQGHGSHLEVKLPCPVCIFKAHMIYIS